MFFQLLISSIAIGSIYALMALAMSITYKASEIPNFGQGEMAMISTFVTFVLVSSYGLGFLPAVILTLIFAFFLGVLLEFVFLIREKRKGRLILCLSG